MNPSPTNHSKNTTQPTRLPVLLSIGFAVSLAVLPGTIQAADWQGNTNSNWNTGTNWSGGVVPNSEGAYITSSIGNIATISSNVAGVPTELQVGTWSNTGRLDHTAGSLSLVNANWPYGWLLLGGGTNGSGTYNIADTAASGGTFTGFGAGSGSLSVGGDIRVGAGAWWDHATGVLNINTSGTVHANGSLVAGTADGDMGIVNIDSGAVTVFGDYGNSAQFGFGSSTATGILNISGGSLTLSNRLALGVGTGSSAGGNVGTVTLSGGTLTTDVGHDEDWHAGVNMASGYDTATGGTATVNLNGGTLSTLRVFSETGDTGIKGTSTFNFNGGTLQAQNSRGNFMEGLTLANVRDGGVVVDTNGFDVTINQALLHSNIVGDNTIDGGFTKNGTGVLTLSAQHTFTGAVTVNAGTLYANAGNGPTDRSFSYTSGITVNDGGTLRASVNSLFGWDGSQAKPITINAGGTAIAESEDQNVGLVTLNGGTLASSGAIGDWGSWNFGRATEKKLLVTDNSTVSALEVGFHNGATIEVTSGKNLNFTGSITDSNDGASAVIKTGTGTLQLTAANTYSGGTTVSAGTLEVNNTSGSGTGGGTVTVDAGAKLSGAGNVTTAANNYVYLNGTLQVGFDGAAAGSAFSLTTSGTGSTVLGASSLVTVDLLSTTGTDMTSDLAAADMLRLFGTLDIMTGATLLLNNPNALTFTIGDVFQVFDWTSLTASTGSWTLDTSAIDVPVGAYVDTSNLYTSGTVSVSSVPEPSRAMLLMLGAAGLMLRRRRQSGPACLICDRSLNAS